MCTTKPMQQGTPTHGAHTVHTTDPTTTTTTTAAHRFAEVLHDLRQWYPKLGVDATGNHSSLSDDPDENIGNVPHERGQYKGVNISIEVSDTFDFDTPEDMDSAVEGFSGAPDDGTYVYSRSFNPTVQYLGRFLAALEDTECAYCTSSGMSAITAVIMHLCHAGGHVVASETIYAGTHYLLEKFLPKKSNIFTTFVDITDLKAVESAIIPMVTKVLYFDSVANPTLVVADIAKLSEIAHRHGVLVVVDNTLTPMILTPEKYGADVVVHSLTKYVSGGGDIIAGAICGSKKLIKDMTNFAGSALMMLGPVMNPKEAFDLLGRLAHSSMRVKKHSSRALKLAENITNNKNDFSLIKYVVYPGLKDHPDHTIIDTMQNKGYGYGGVLCFDMETKEKAQNFLRCLKKHKFGFLAVSLGYYETLMSRPGATVKEEFKKLIEDRPYVASPGYVRICVGYMGTFDQKWKQFKDAYEEFKMGKQC